MSVIVSRATKQLLVPGSSTTANMFPNAKAFDDRLLVPHGIRETVILRQLGFKVPNPMLLYYDWSGGKPFAVQRATCDMLTANPRSYVLNDMGTGKTKTALWAWDYLRRQGLVGKLLVVAPLSTLNFVWGREVFATLPHRNAVVLHGSRARRHELLADEAAEIFLINHDGLKIVMAELANRPDIDALVIDELAVYRNNSERSKVMRKFATRCKTVWGLTGAPMPNAPTDVWAQAKIVTPMTVPAYFKHARDQLMTRLDQFRWVPKPDAVDTAFKMMQPAVRYSLDDVVELPDLVSRTIDIPLSPQQEKIYGKMVKEFKVLVDEKVITAANAGAAMNKLLQVSCGWVYTVSPEYVALECQPRTDVLLDLVNSSAHKVLVFVPYRHALAGLSKVLDAAHIDHAVVHGGTGDRDQIFNKFQNTDKFKVLLAHPQCLAHGLTLTVADTIIWWSPMASLEIYEQANARIRRVGQKHRQQVLHLQSTAVEKKIYALLRGKKRVQDQLLAMLEEATGKAA